MIRIALDVDHLWRYILGLIANRINKDATAHGTIRTGGARLGGTGNLEFFKLRNRGSQIKSQERDTRSTSERAFEEGSAGEFHCASSDRFDCKPRSEIQTAPKLTEKYSPTARPRSNRIYVTPPTRTNLQTYAVACRDPKPHNRPVANTPWQQRIRRAEKLAAQHAFAVEILGFYIHVARFQQSLYLRIEKASAKKDPVPPPGLPESPELLTSFPSFLSLVEEKAPVRFAQVAHDLRNSSSGSWSDLLNKCWSTADEP